MSRKRYRYDPDQDAVIETTAEEEPRVDVHGVSIRFKPHVSYQPHADDAKDLGLKRTKNKGTVFETERQLNNYLARERDKGRDTAWKDT